MSANASPDWAQLRWSTELCLLMPVAEDRVKEQRAGFSIALRLEPAGCICCIVHHFDVPAWPPGGVKRRVSARRLRAQKARRFAV
jgi:hypothetical protein